MRRDFENETLWRRAKGDALRVVFGGILAAALFSFIGEFDYLQYSPFVNLVVIAVGLAAIGLVSYLIAFAFYQIELLAPDPQVELTEEAVDEIASKIQSESDNETRVSAELEESRRDRR